jgi:hypothetical protein
MRTARAPGFIVILFMLAGGLRCAYAPNPKSGTLLCSETTPKQCPEGYDCDGTFCTKKGEADAGMTGVAGQTGAAGAGGKAGTGGTGGKAGTGGAGGTGGTAGTGGTGDAAGAAVPTAKFVGHWVFDAGSTENVTCSDGSNKDNALAGDYVDVALNTALGANVISASYFCDWNLNVGPAGQGTVIRPGQSCSRNVTDASTGVTKFTWHGTTFTFGTTDGKTATLVSMIGVEFIDDPTKTGCSPTTTSCTGTCTIKLTGTLTNAP